jgi:ligand-binding sensor domain-containing protein/AraC-like DNA-binding protein
MEGGDGVPGRFEVLDTAVDEKKPRYFELDFQLLLKMSEESVTMNDLTLVYRMKGKGRLPDLLHVTSLFLFLLLPSLLSSIDPSKTIRQYILETWQQKDGLTVDVVHDLAQSAEGFLFIGTEDGLFRFDGVKFTCFNKGNTPQLHDNLIATLETDEAGTMWIGMIRGGGLAYYQQGRFGRLPGSGGLDRLGVTVLCRDGTGGMWVGTWGSGLYHIQAGRISESYDHRHGLASDIVFSLCIGHDQSLWIGHWGGGLSRLRDGKLNRFGPGEGLENDVVWSVHEDRDGAIWAATRDGLFRFDGRRFRRHNPSGETIRTLFRDRDGNTWIGSWNGVRRWNDGPQASLTSRDGLAGDMVKTMFEDREGSLWIGTFHGLSRLRDGDFRVFGRPEGLGGDIIQSVCPGSSGRVWLGVDGKGLFEYREGKIFQHRIGAAHIDDSVLSLAEDQAGRLWIAGTGGVVLFEAGHVLSEWTRPFLGKDNYARLVYPDRQGTIWMAAAKGGLHRISADLELGPLPLDPAIASLSVKVILEDKGGRYWFGTETGLIVAGLEQGVLCAKSTILQGHEILALVETEAGEIWAGTEVGMVLCQLGPPVRIQPITGIEASPVFAIVDDRCGHLWLSQAVGIVRVAVADLRTAIAEGKPLTRFRRFDSRDGLRSAICNDLGRPAACMDGSGSLWFATHEGAAVVQPDHLNINRIRPRTVIEEVLADGRSIPAASAIDLRPGTKRIDFRFTASSLSIPDRVRFRFRLQGVDSKWRANSDVDRKRTVGYGHLPPGKMVFRIIAENDSSIPGEETALTIVLPPLLWQRRWFYPFLALVAVTIFAAFFWRNWRRRSLRRSPLPTGDVIAWKDRLQELMEEEKPFLDPSLQLPELAGKLGLSVHQLSQVINDGFGRNFREFINSLRIEEAKRLLTDPRSREYKLLTVAFESGFNSKATFNQVFRKLTGTTPSEYRERNAAASLKKGMRL